MSEKKTWVGRVPVNYVKQAELSHSAAFTLVALMCHADNKTGRCFPGVKALADFTKLTRRTVQRAIRELTEKGFIEVTQHLETSTKTGNQFNRTNNYFVPGSVIDTPPSRNDYAPGASECHPGGVTVTHEHSRNRPLNNTKEPPRRGDDFIDSVLTEIEEEVDG